MLNVSNAFLFSAFFSGVLIALLVVLIPNIINEIIKTALAKYIPIRIRAVTISLMNIHAELLSCLNVPSNFLAFFPVKKLKSKKSIWSTAILYKSPTITGIFTSLSKSNSSSSFALFLIFFVTFDFPSSPSLTCVYLFFVSSFCNSSKEYKTSFASSSCIEFASPCTQSNSQQITRAKLVTPVPIKSFFISASKSSASAAISSDEFVPNFPPPPPCVTRI